MLASRGTSISPKTSQTLSEPRVIPAVENPKMLPVCMSRPGVSSMEASRHSAPRKAETSPAGIWNSGPSRPMLTTFSSYFVVPVTGRKT
ncbi:hypothetical protein D3C85_817060 [compost metagenome]